MSEKNFQWGCEPFPADTRGGEGCGESHWVVSGIVFDEQGADLAFYFAHLLAHEEVRQARLFIGLLVTDQRNRELKKNFVSLVLRMDEGNVAATVVNNPHDRSGRTMTREEALKSSLLPFVFYIDNFIL